jgi:type II secretory pathway pseudopilin PulG
MLVVLAIIGIMAAIIIPQVAFSQKGAGLKGAATDMMSTLRTARRMAIAEREYRVLALNLFSIPGEFVIMRPGDATTPWIPVGKTHRLPDNIAIVSVADPAWTTLDVTRTDDRNPIDGAPEDLTTVPTIYNPGHANGVVNDLFRLIRFYPTGTADAAMIYLWNVTEERREIPNPSPELSAANLANLGVPPGLIINNINDQTTFFRVPTDDSEDDAYYYTLVVNRLTGSVEVYDYAWGYNGAPNQWDRKKDGG